MALLATTLLQAQRLHYPNAVKDGTVDNYFGESVADPYRWLENDTSQQTAAWVEAENRVTNAYLQRIPFRQKLLKRLTELANYEKIGAPRQRHGKWYFYQNNGLQNQYVLYQMDRLGDEPRVFLDPNTLSTDGTVALKGTYFSHNGRWMAYAVSRSGSDWQEFYVMDVNTGQLTADHIEWAKFSGAAWQGDGFYYSAYDRPEGGKEYSNVNEGMKIYYHKLGTPQSDDVLFYQNPTQPKRFYEIAVNEEETLMFLYEAGAGAGNNLFVRDLRQKDSQFIQLTDNMDYQYMPVYDDGTTIWLYTNYGAPKGRIMTVDIRRPGISQWHELIAEQQNTLNGVDVINRQLILNYSQDACDHAFVYGLDGQLRHEVALPTVGSVGFTGDKHGEECFYTFTSFTMPGTIYRYDMASNQSTLYAQPTVRFRQQDYVTQQVFFQSKDGTRVPMFLTYKKQGSSKAHKPRPVYLYGYGGFNIALGPSFSSNRIPFLEQGGIYAQVNLRGGSEYGEEWHLAGTKMQKQNVFDDFIAAAEYLVREHYTTPDLLAIVGGSNGGLLVGACMTQRPDLYRVAIPQVGVMDMLRYHKFTIGWNWASDYGTSDDSPEMFRYLRAYSPLHNLRPGTAYPATLVTTADHDDRVVPAHSFKFAATLQECQTATQQQSSQPLPPVLIRIDTKAGHGGGKPLAKVLEEQADIYSFILYNMGLTYK
jgi:prolyl oligopeptidase